MASKKAQAALAKRKEANQKKVLFLLIPVFIGLIAWQGPKTFKALTGGSTPPTPTTAAPATTTGAPTPGSAPSTPGAGASAATSGLVDTDTPPSALAGQLTNFSVFPGRDPFSGGPSTDTGSTTDTTTTTTTPTSARLQVNGDAEDVSINGTFPESDPVFKLVSVTTTSAVIALASGGKFSDGNSTEVIKVGETLTVVGSDGSSFLITLVSVGSG
jgi:cytoskeletal protein RodZ